VSNSEGFSGADIEAVIKETVENAFFEQRDFICTEDLYMQQTGIFGKSAFSKGFIGKGRIFKGIVIIVEALFFIKTPYYCG